MTNNEARVGAVVAFIVLLVVFISGVRHGMKKSAFFPIPTSEEATQAYAVKELSPSTEAATSATAKVGDQAIVPEWGWVEIINREPVMQGNYELSQGEICGIEFGGNVTVIEILARGELVVRYEAPRTPIGTPCPSGVLFAVSEGKFGAMTAQYHKAVDTARIEMDLVERLLSKNYYGEKMDAGRWRWVAVVNIDPAYYSNFQFSRAYGDSCAIGRGISAGNGTIHSRGEEGGRVLYEYTSHDESAGTSCPTGTLFFEDKKL